MNRIKYTPPRVASFDSVSLDPETTQLFEWDFPKAPEVYYTPLVWESIRYLVDTIPSEVGWLGIADKFEDTGNYLVTDIYVPEQTVSGVETDISAEALTKLAVELESQNIPSEKLIYWGHSHVNMGVTPSMQDELQIEDFLENGCEFFIRGIYNKRGDSKVDVYDTQQNCVHQCVRNGLQPTELDDLLKTRLDSLIKTNVKKPVVKAFPKSKLGAAPTYMTYVDPYDRRFDYDPMTDEEYEREAIMQDAFGVKDH